MPADRHPERTSMDPVFDAQYRNMKDRFARQGVEIEIAYTPGGAVDYVYQVGRLLAAPGTEVYERLTGWLPGLRRAAERLAPAEDEMAVLSIEGLERGHTTVPEAMAIIDERYGDDNPGRRPEGRPDCSP